VSYRLLIRINEIESKEDAIMKADDPFYLSSGAVFDGKFVYAVDINRTMHIYSIKERAWKIIPTNNL